MPADDKHHAFLGPGGLSLEEAAKRQAELLPLLRTDEAGEKINAAAQLLTSRRFDDCIAAYQTIAVQHPDRAGDCLGQIGACYFFKGEFSTAIDHYTLAKEKGADPGMMDDNIQEAEEELAKDGLDSPTPNDDSPPRTQSLWKSPTIRLLLKVAVFGGVVVLLALMVIGGAIALLLPA